MKKLLLIIMIAMFFIPVLTAKDLVWNENLNLALEQAKKSNKPVFIDFTGSDWCVWCQKLDGEVFSKKEFIAYAEKNLILVKIDFPKKNNQSAEQKANNKAWLEKYGIEGFPTIVLLDSKGNLVDKTGYQEGGAEKYVKHIKELLAKKK